MKSDTFENLLLLEFLINKVTFYESKYNIDRNYLDQLGETRIQVKVNSCCFLEITEDENCKSEIDEHGNRVVTFESGKSCLLSIGQIMNNSNNVARMCVERKDPCGGPMGFCTFGEANLSLEPILKVVKKGGKSKKSIKSIKGSYKFIDRQCVEAGVVDLFMRATNLGKKVTTMFQLGAGEGSFYYKGTETDPCSSVDDDESSLFGCPQLETGENLASKSARLEQFHNDEKQSKTRCRPCPGSQKSTCQSRARFPGVFPDNAYQFQSGGLPANRLPLLQYNMPTMPGSMMPGIGIGGPGIAAGVPGTSFGGPSMAMTGTGAYAAPPNMMMGGPGMSMAGPDMSMGGAGVMGSPGMNIPSYGYQNPDMLGGYSGYPQPMQDVTYRDEDYEQLDGDYKEISAEVNGYEIKIKLLRRPKKNLEL